jgi:uncharacterized RDD family membrane protein YckC
VTRTGRHPWAQDLRGHRAGFASRLMADAVDLGIIWLLCASLLLLAGVARYLLVGPPFGVPALRPWLSGPLGAFLAVAYLAAGWATTGRTPGKQLAGLRVVDRAGHLLRPPRAILRALLYVLFPAGLLWVLVSRSNASVQDLLVRTAVLYDWSYHRPEP